MIELNAILYYADFLSMKETSTPVTDTCKYFFIHGAPINACYIANVEPMYDPENQYFKQSKEEFEQLRDRFGEAGAMSFIDDICSLKACGTVSGENMLRCIHQYGRKKEFEQALSKYNKWKKDLIFQHIIKDEDGRYKHTTCTKAIAHFEKHKGLPVESSIYESAGEDYTDVETTVKNND